MTYIPQDLALLRLDELRRRADAERRSGQVARLDRPARSVETRRRPRDLRLTALRRAVTHG